MSDVIRVLLVEDDPDDVFLVRDMLSAVEHAAFRVETVGTLAGAVDKAKAGQWDIVLLDLSLPDSFGMETVTRMIRAMPHKPVVVLTGLQDEAVGVQAVRHGAEDYLTKGRIDANVLVRSVRHAIERRRIKDEIERLNARLEEKVGERTKELVAARDELARANDDLRELDRLKSAFIDVTSHELRTPAVVLGGMAQLIARHSKTGEELPPGALDTLIHSARRIEALVSCIFDAGNMADFARRLNLSKTDLAALLRMTAEDVAPFVHARKQNLEVDLPPALPPMMADERKIHDVLMNLLMNAVKFTPDGGTIRLSARISEPGRVEVRVADTGVGIPERSRRHIFEEFFTDFDTLHHASGDFAFGARGVGLGLAITKKFVEMHGGEIGFQSEEGKGSTFFFRIPLICPSEPNQV